MSAMLSIDQFQTIFIIILFYSGDREWTIQFLHIFYRAANGLNVIQIEIPITRPRFYR